MTSQGLMPTRNAGLSSHRTIEIFLGDDYGYILRFSGMAEIRQENDSESSDVDILEVSLDN
jgi:hypothetical protein